MKYYVYQLRLQTSPSPFYIGKGSGDRAKRHLHPSRLKACSHKNHVINKAIRDGVDDLVEILHEGLTESEAHAKEVELIAFYGRHNFGGCLTNATDGGEGSSGHIHSAETKQKLSAINAGRLVGEDTRRKMSASKRGMNRNAKASEDTRRKMSASKLGCKNNGWLGYYVTPWGTFESLKEAADASPNPISQPTLSSYCRTNNDKVFTGHATKKFIIAKTPRESGFSFIPAHQP